jgi:hypothetical protein
MRKILIIVFFCCAGVYAADIKEPCLTNPQADACGPGEIKFPFLGQESGFIPGRGLPATAGKLQASSSAVSAGIPSPAIQRAKPAKSVPTGSTVSTPTPIQAEIALFYTYDCPHCRKAINWLSTLNAAYPGLRVNTYEVKRDKNNLALFAQYLAKHKAAPSGFPTFFVGDKLLVGFTQTRTPGEITAALHALAGKTGCPCENGSVNVPMLGKIDPSSVSMLNFSLALGLLDGLNPCAMWVLMFLMGLLAYTGSPRKMLIIGGIFTVASALVYFAFMAAWFNLFLIIGHARWITTALGVIAAVMGLVNLKEIFFFRRGVSLMISGKAKIKLGEKIRLIITERETAVMIAATAALAVFVNLIELGCTIGLPAVFTRVLSLRQAGFWHKYGYMAVYNVAYIVPLAFIIALFVFTTGRYRMTEAHGKILKGISGALMLALGVLMLLKPEAMIFK